MRICLVGAPDTNKQKIASDLQTKFPGYLRSNELGRYESYAKGNLGDYRLELSILHDRLWFLEDNKDVICTHSLIDSVYYATKRWHTFASIGNPSNTTLWTSQLTASISLAIMKDTFVSDLTCMIPGGDPEVEDALRESLEFFELPYLEMSSDPDQTSAEIISRMEKDGKD